MQTAHTAHPIIAFLQRDGAIETWRYERRVILLVEALCLAAGIAAAPTRASALALLVAAPLSLYAAELARADRSAKAREREQAEALGLPRVELTCRTAIDLAAKERQLVVAAWPFVSLAMTVAGSGWQGLTRAVLVGFAASLIRWGMVEAYGIWRAWYRARVSPRVIVRAAP